MPTAHLATLSLILSAAALHAADATPPAWEPVGWGGGAFYFAAAWHPTANNVIYLGGDCAGVYRSDNSGQRWRFANQGIRDYAIYSLAVSPAAPDLIYTLSEGGLHKSLDQAHSWNFISDSAAAKLDICASRAGSVRAIAIDPVNADIVYAGSRTGKMFKTIDGGQHWSELPYRDALPKDIAPHAYIGTGALSLTYSADVAGMDTMGRISRTFGADKQAKDWSAYKKLSAQLQVPDGTPALEAALVIQSGDSWQWQQGAWIACKPGVWSDVALDLTALKNLNSVRMLHVVVRSPHAAWKGDILVDAMALQSEATGALTAGQAPDGKNTIMVADWETPGDAEGWSANREYKDSLHITAARQSQAKKSNDIVSTVAIASNEPASVYVANTIHGIFRSTDAGSTWTHLPGPKKVLGITVSATNPQVVWAACGPDGLQQSTDRGQTWTAITEMLFDKVEMREVVLPANTPQLIYAIGNNGWAGSLFRSDDGGKKWTRSNTVHVGMPGNPTNPQEGGHDDYAKGTTGLSTVTNLAVNPQNSAELFISCNWRNVYSGDGGKTLEERSTGADNTCATDIQFLGGKTYVTAMDEGLLVSDNQGGEWRQLTPLKYDANVSGHFWRVRVAKVGDSVRIVTTASPWQSYGNTTCANRAYVSSDDGKSFTQSSAGLPDYIPNVNCMWGRSFPRALAADPTNPNVVYLGMDGDPEPAKKLPGGGVFRSADGGNSWTRCAGQPGGRRMYYGLAVDPSDSKRLYWSSCGEGGGAWRSEDEGATWQHVFSAESWCFNLEVAPSGMALVGGKDLHRSTDHGKTWTKITAFTGDPTIVGIAVDPANEQRIWISRTTWDSSSNGGIFRTIDGGATWQDITGDIPFRKPQILRYDPTTRMLWAGGVGLYRLAQ